MNWTLTFASATVKTDDSDFYFVGSVPDGAGGKTWLDFQAVLRNTGGAPLNLSALSGTLTTSDSAVRDLLCMDGLGDMVAPALAGSLKPNRERIVGCRVVAPDGCTGAELEALAPLELSVTIGAETRTQSFTLADVQNLEAAVPQAPGEDPA